jgi:hypothetical protein
MQQDEDLKRIDEMIATVSDSHDAAPWDLLLDRLRTARRYLLSSGSGEYKFALQQAMESAGWIPDKTVRAGTKKTLRSLMDSETSTAQRSTAGGIAYASPSAAPAPVA